jgi:hypothetical protein
MPDFFLAPDAGLGPSVPMTSQYGEQNVDYTYTPIPAGPMPPNYVEWPGPQASISPFSNTHVFPVSSPTFPPAGPHVGRPPSQPLHSPLPFQETGNVQSMIPFQPVHGQHGHGHRSQTPRPMPIIMFNNDDAVRGPSPLHSLPSLIHMPLQPRQSAKDSWKNITTTAKCAGPGGMFIPQRIYRPPTDSDRARYVSQVTLDEPIVFMSTSPEEHGIHLVDALHCRTRRLLGRDETVFDGRGPSVSIRVEASRPASLTTRKYPVDLLSLFQWPCYGSWSRQIPTRDFRTPPGPITREKLAKNIAKQIERFIKVEHPQHANPPPCLTVSLLGETGLSSGGGNQPCLEGRS